MEKDLILNVKDLVVRFETDDGIVRAVNGLDLQIERGHAIGLVGETGAGKTTTALSLLRLVPDPPGVVECEKIELDGKDVLSMSVSELEKVRGKDISMIFQDPMTSLNPVITIGKQITSIILKHQDCSEVEARERAPGMRKHPEERGSAKSMERAKGNLLFFTLLCIVLRDLAREPQSTLKTAQGKKRSE